MKKLFMPLMFFLLALSYTGNIKASSSLVNLDVLTKVLENGLHIYLVNVKYIPAVNVSVYYNVGSKDENDTERGLSHFLEHMMFKTTKSLKAGEYAKLVRNNGGYSNAATSFDYTYYYSTLPSDKLELALKLEADRMVNLTLDENEFNSEKKVVIEELRQRYENSPVGYLWTNFIQDAYKVSNYGKPVIGTMKSLIKLNTSDMRQYYRRFYSPNNAHLIVVGNFDKSNAYALIDKYFKNLKRQNIGRPLFTEEPLQTKEKRFLYKKRSQLSHGMIYFNGPAALDPDSSPLEMIELILFSGRSARLVRKLVIEKGLAARISGGQYLRRHLSPFAITFSARQKELLPKIEEAVYAELEKFKSGNFTQYELNKAKNAFLSSYIKSLDTIKSISETIGSGAMLGNYKFYTNLRIKRILSATKEDLIRVAKKYFKKTNRNVAYLIPKQR
jgi:zinc protease